MSQVKRGWGAARGLYVGLLLLAAMLFAAACRSSDGSSSAADGQGAHGEQPSAPAAAKVTLVSIALTPPTASAPVTVVTPFKATGTYSNGTTRPLTTGLTWTVSDATLASVDGTGAVTALAPGAVTVTATTATGVSGAASLTVTSATLTSVAITPAAKTLPMAGTTATFVATGIFSDGTHAPLLGAVTWSTTNPSVASISASGVVTAISPGTAAVAALHPPSGLGAKAILTVGTAKLSSITVTPARSSLPAGLEEPLVATATYTDGTAMDVTAAATWTTSSAAVATVSNDPSAIGTVTGLTTGKATVTATLSGKKGSSALTITAATLSTLAVTPAIKSVVLATKLQLTATGTYSNGTTQNLTSKVSWTSSSPGLSVSNATGSHGLATAVGPQLGEATVSASLGVVTGTAGIDVISSPLVSVTVTPASTQAPLGLAQQFFATGNYADGTTEDITPLVTWSADVAAVATLSNADDSIGLATPVALGTTTVRALEPSSGITGTASLQVIPGALVAAIVYPSMAAVPSGLAQQFTVIGTYTDGSQQDLTTAMTWNVLAPGVATISNAAGSQGLASTGAQGVNTIQAIDPTTQVAATATLSVGAASVELVAIAPANSVLYDGKTAQLKASATFTDGTVSDITSSVTWQSNAASIAVSAAGIATASGAGGAVISATTATGTVGYTQLNALRGAVTQCAGKAQGVICGGSAGTCGTQTVCDGAGACSIPSLTSSQLAQRQACFNAYQQTVLTADPDPVAFQSAEDALYTCIGLPTSCEVVHADGTDSTPTTLPRVGVSPNATIYDVPCVDVPTGQKCIEDAIAGGAYDLGSSILSLDGPGAGSAAVSILQDELKCPSQNCASNMRCVTGSAGTLCCNKGQTACGSECMDTSDTCCSSGDGQKAQVCGPSQNCDSCSGDVVCVSKSEIGTSICCNGEPCFGPNADCVACGL